jgi:formate dehydrogenase subunit beta
MSDRLPALREAIEKLLPEVDGVLGLKTGPGGIVAPHLFVRERAEALKALAIWPKEPVPDLLKKIQKAHPDAKLAIVCRGCEERGIVEMSKHVQINLANVTLIGLQCTHDEAVFCRCGKPYTAHAQTTVGARVEGVPDSVTDDFLKKNQAERLAFWKEHFLHCIKCYGCRNTCPQCFCNVCALEAETWVETGRLPMPVPPMYHLVRAMHMTAKCVACRECEETCPAGIPLAIHFRLIARDVEEMFKYETGAVIEQSPPQLLVLEEGDYERTGLPH